MAFDLQLPLDTQPRIGGVEFDRSDVESDLDLPWVENLITAVGAAFTAMFVSSVAVLMYLA